MCMPGQINVQGRHSHFIGMRDHDLEENVVFANQSFHGGCDSWRMDPVEIVHLLNKCALTNDGSDQIQAEDGAVLPVVRHHAPNGNSFLAFQSVCGTEVAVCVCGTGVDGDGV